MRNSPVKMTLIQPDKENNYIQSKKYIDEGKLARLIKERSSLIDMGYGPKDDLIREIDNQIKDINSQ